MRNVLKVRRADQPTVKTDLQAVIYQNLTPGTLGAPLADRWEPDYPKAVACLRDDLDELLTLVPQIPRSAQTAQDYQRHRTSLPRSPTTNPAQGRLLRPHLDRPHPLRRLQS